MTSLLPGPGRPLQEKFYAEDCALYNFDHSKINFHVLLDKMDIFVPAHFFGWMIKVQSYLTSFQSFTTSSSCPNLSMFILVTE